MKAKNNLRSILFVTLLMLLAPIGLQSHSLIAQGKNKASAQTKTEKGEVDKLIEKLRKRHDRLLIGCLENCKVEKDSTASVVARVDIKQPSYPATARAAHAFGEVVVRLIIDEEGKVIAAQADSGHPLLREVSVKAAKESRFATTRLEGRPVKVLGTITYRFVPSTPPSD
jgi:TonB family protein